MLLGFVLITYCSNCGVSKTATLQHRVVQANAFIREEEEQVILDDWTADASCELAILLLTSFRALAAERMESRTARASLRLGVVGVGP